MKFSHSLLGLAAVLVSTSSAQEVLSSATSTYTAVIYRTTTVTRSTCSNGELPCTLSATPFVFAYSYPVTTNYITEPTTKVEEVPLTLPRNGSYIVTTVPTTTVIAAGETLTAVSWTTGWSTAATITLHSTSTSTITVGKTRTMYLPGDEPSATSSTTEAAASSTSTSCTETYSFTGSATIPLKTYAPLYDTDTKSYTSTKFVVITKTIALPGMTETETEKSTATSAAPYPDYSSTQLAQVGTGTSAPYPTDTPAPFLPNAGSNLTPFSSGGLLVALAAGALVQGLFIFFI